MIEVTRTLVRRWLDVLLHIDDTPQRTAAAYAVGVFFGFSPFLGLHTALAIACAFAFNLNRVAVLLGVYSNLPWIIVAYYAGVTMFGSVLTSVRLPPDFRERLVALFELPVWRSAFWEHLVLLMRPLLWPYVVGSLIGATVLAIAAYPLALTFVSRRRDAAAVDKN